MTRTAAPRISVAAPAADGVAAPTVAADAAYTRLQAVLHGEPRRGYRLALAALRRTPVRHIADRALMARAAGAALYLLSDYAASEKMLRQAERLAQRAGNARLEARCCSGLGVLNIRRGAFDKAMAYFQRMLALMERAQDREGVAAALHEIACLYADLGATEISLTYCRRALRHEDVLAPWLHTSLLNCQATGLAALGEFDPAAAVYREALRNARQRSDWAQVAMLLGNLGRSLSLQGRHAEARATFAEALRVHRGKPFSGLRAELLAHRADDLRAEDVARARRLVREALRLATQVGDANVEREALAVAARVERAGGDSARAWAYFERFHELDTQFKQQQLRFLGRLQAAASASVAEGSDADRRAAALARANRRLQRRLADLEVQRTAAQAAAAAPSAKGQLSTVQALTRREREILALLARGLSNVSIATQLSLSRYTVRHHVSAILRKLDVTRRTEAAVLATREHLVG